MSSSISMLVQPDTAKGAMGSTPTEKYGFLAANLVDDTNYIIKLGPYEWRVQQTLISKHSVFFKTLCKGSFKEAKNNEVILHEDNPWIFARVIQWMYSTGFEYGQHAPPDGFLALDALMASGVLHPDHATLKAADAKRSKTDINCAVFSLAEKYDVVELRKSVASMLVGVISRSFESFEYTYFKVWDTIHRSFHDFPSQKKEMASILVLYILETAPDDAFRGRLDTRILTKEPEFLLMVYKSMERKAINTTQLLKKRQREADEKQGSAKKVKGGSK